MDTTYFGRKWGVMVLYDACSKRALMVVAVERETNALYTQAVAALREKGIEIQSIICDGKSGLLDSFLGIPVQMCQFHQIKIIVRHLSRKPKSRAAQALRALSLTLTETTQAAFEAALKRWYEQYAAFLNERSVNEKTGRSHYKRLRTAYNSLKRHLPWLFTCEHFPDPGIPNTTNLLEGKFSEMKQLLQCHRGLKKESKLRFIKDYFSKK
ncbi:Transposase, Mutator family [Cardiobacterium valvarum]|uniref:Transposase, Mutator family n=3 Tax=Cardiobacterium valvarum TaxID=194702 RepID=A0A381EB76_9GAMM|nr:Transposase, Mutator family [Cardiobacterium valvarum]